MTFYIRYDSVRCILDWFRANLKRQKLGGVNMTPGRLSRQREFTPVPSRGSILDYMVPPKTVMPARVIPASVHSSCCTGARISLPYEISQRYHVNAKRSLVSVWNQSAGKLERVAHAQFPSIQDGVVMLVMGRQKNDANMYGNYEIKMSPQYETWAGASFLM